MKERTHQGLCQLGIKGQVKFALLLCIFCLLWNYAVSLPFYKKILQLDQYNECRQLLQISYLQARCWTWYKLLVLWRITIYNIINLIFTFIRILSYFYFSSDFYFFSLIRFILKLKFKTIALLKTWNKQSMKLKWFV
jgi:hypothetical protein